MEHFSRSRGTIENDCLALIEEGSLRVDQVADAETQKRLDPVITRGVKETWVGDAQGRLKPLKEWLDVNLREEVDYFQHRLCLRRHGLAKSKEPSSRPCRTFTTACYDL